MQLLVGASRSNNLESVKYIIDNAKNLDINVEEPDRVKHSMSLYLYLNNYQILHTDSMPGQR